MLVARERLERLDSATVGDFLFLSYDRRLHARQRACLEGGEHIALMLPRGTVLRDGDVLRCEGGRLVRVRAAPECISRIASSNPLHLARAAYHLGNRHVPTELGKGFVAYLHDHVLDDMVQRLGLEVTVATAPFDPEPGAYGHTEPSPPSSHPSPVEHSHPLDHSVEHPHPLEHSSDRDSSQPPA
ncbi:MAG TPA: urease accessory protein UreE [Polyangiaceae bacterium]|nr:urease accessory protein UreE [Polyangiaceae bacterium]